MMIDFFHFWLNCCFNLNGLESKLKSPIQSMCKSGLRSYNFLWNVQPTRFWPLSHLSGGDTYCTVQHHTLNRIEKHYINKRLESSITLQTSFEIHSTAKQSHSAFFTMSYSNAASIKETSTVRSAKSSSSTIRVHFLLYCFFFTYSYSLQDTECELTNIKSICQHGRDKDEGVIEKSRIMSNAWHGAMPGS